MPDARRAREYAVRRDSRQTFVDQMLVRGTAAEIFRIRRARVAVARLHEHQRDRRCRLRRIEDVEGSAEMLARPFVADCRHREPARVVFDGLERIDSHQM